MVAKTFQNLEQIGEPFEDKGKKYINVRAKNDNIKRVRWYEVDEYLKMYPDASRKDIDPYYKPLKHLFCKNEDYFWVFKDARIDNEVLRANQYVWYHTSWGWYIRPDAPKEEIEKLQKDFTMRQLYWNEIAIDENTLKSVQEIKRRL